MSDIQFRTDQFNAQNKQFYDAQRYQSMDRMGQTIGNTAQNIVQNSQVNAQLDMRRVMTEIASREADSALRLQEIEAERQLQQNKMASIMMMDELDQSKARTVLVQQQAEAAKMANERQKRINSQMYKYGVDELPMEIAMRTGGRMLLGDSGIVANRDNYDNEIEKRRREDSIRKTLDSLAARNRNDFGEVKYDEQTKAFADFLEGKLRSSMGGAEFDAYMQGRSQNGQPQPQAPQPSSNGQATTGAATQSGLSPQVEQMAGHLYGQIQRDPQWSQFWGGLDKPTQSRVMATMATYANDLLGKAGMSYPQEMAPVLVFQAFETDPMVASNILATAGYDDEQIRNVLLARGMDDKAITGVLGRLKDYVQSIRKRQQ